MSVVEKSATGSAVAVGGAVAGSGGAVASRGAVASEDHVVLDKLAEQRYQGGHLLKLHEENSKKSQ